MPPCPPALRPALVLALAGCAQAAAESRVDVPDAPWTRQHLLPGVPALPARIHQLRYPVVGMPALVPPGSSFTARLEPGCPVDMERVQAVLRLVGAPDVRVPLTVTGWQVEGTRLDLGLRVPVDVGADHYDLLLTDGGCLDDAQPSAVRVYHPGATWRFAVLADEQLGDPRARRPLPPLNGTAFRPAPGLEDPADRFAAQVQAELEFLDPLLVLYPGDLVFGMDYPGEYDRAWRRLAGARLAVFAVPGNHDGYAAHRLVPRDGWHRHAASLAWCGRHVLAGDPLDAVLGLGVCTVKALAANAAVVPEVDGLGGFLATLGPDTYAFRVEGLRFVGLSTYGGSAARRTAVPLSLGRLQAWTGTRFDLGLDPTLGAPLVDNYGGFVLPSLQEWVAGQVQAGRAAGEGIVLFGHHDPTGRFRDGTGVLPDAPFGTDPVSRGGFEVWNYEDGSWESEPTDGVGVETATRHSGTTLLEGLGGGPATFFCGHTHRDGTTTLPSGITVVQTTTAGVEPDAGGYRGYRLVSVEDGVLTQVDFDRSRGWGSVPAGHLWVEPVGPHGAGRVVVNGLPEPVSGRLRFALPPAPGGYRFSTGRGVPVPLADLTWTPDRLVAYVALEVPAAPGAAPVAREVGDFAREAVVWEAVPGNSPPEASIRRPGEGDRRAARPLRVRAGRAVQLTAVESEDPDGILRSTWRWSGGELSGEVLRWVAPAERAEETIELVVYDAYGARGRTTRGVRVRCGFLGWACRSGPEADVTPAP